jgi:hypothetical protein
LDRTADKSCHLGCILDCHRFAIEPATDGINGRQQHPSQDSLGRIVHFVKDAASQCGNVTQKVEPDCRLRADVNQQLA